LSVFLLITILIGVSLPSQEDIYFASFYDFPIEFGTVPAMWYFCFVSFNCERQTMLHSWSIHHYVLVPDWWHVCRVRKANFTTNHRHPYGNKLYLSVCWTFPILLWC